MTGRVVTLLTALAAAIVGLSTIGERSVPRYLWNASQSVPIGLYWLRPIGRLVVTELVAGRPHPLKGNRLGQFALDLHGGVRLVFESSQDPVPKNADKSIAWNQVSKVRIVFIGDYHD